MAFILYIILFDVVHNEIVSVDVRMNDTCSFGYI